MQMRQRSSLSTSVDQGIEQILIVVGTVERQVNVLRLKMRPIVDVNDPRFVLRRFLRSVPDENGKETEQHRPHPSTSNEMKPLNEKTFVLAVVEVQAAINQPLGEDLLAIVVEETVQLIELIVGVRLVLVGCQTEKDFVCARPRDEKREMRESNLGWYWRWNSSRSVDSVRKDRFA